jgi:hypothetical protein
VIDVVFERICEENEESFGFLSKKIDFSRVIVANL